MNVVLDFIVLLLRIIYYSFESLILALVPRNGKSLARKVALVTGGGRGIGQVVCVELAKRGAIVAVVDLNKASCDETVELIRGAGGTAASFVCDITDTKQIADVDTRIRSELGYVDILVNNAGVGYGGLILKKEDSEIRKTIDANILSQFWTIRQFLPSMIERKSGHIVMISSCLGTITTQAVSDYCTSKFAVHGLSEAILDDLRYMNVKGIEVSTVYPMAVRTQMLSSMEHRVVYRGRFESLLTPEYVGKAIVDGIRLNKRYIFVPAYSQTLKFIQLLPYKAAVAFKQFIESGFYEVAH